MKIRHAIAITLSALLLSGCVSNEFQSATSGTQETNHTPTQSITTTTTGQSDVLTDPPVTTTASAPITTEGVPTTTEIAPITTETVPITTEPAPTTTEPAPVTTDKVPDTTAPEDDPPSAPVLEKLTVPSALSGIGKQYPVKYKLYGDFAGLTVAQLMDAATNYYETAKHRSLIGKGRMTLDSGIVSLMLNASRFDLEISYLAGGNATALSSKVTTDKGRVTEDQQVYIGGWLYNNSVSKQNNQQTGTDLYKVQMSQNQFSDYALSGADRQMNDLTVLTQLISTGKTVVAGMDEAGNCIILAKGVNDALLKKLIGADSAIADALSAESCKEMEIAVLIGADGNLKELYFSLPMRMITEQSGIRFSTDGHLSMTLTVDTPKSVSISAPSGGSSYSAITIEQAYARDDAWLLW